MTDMPRDNLFRSAPRPELRAADDGSGPRKLVVNFSRASEWTEINSIFEGRFMEQIAPRSFDKTFSEQRDQIRAIAQHGRDPIAGDKPLGTITDLREDKDGAWGEVDLFDADYVRQFIPGLEAGQYGASFAFRVTREDVNQDPGPSDHNPAGIPERTIREVSLREFGPVTWGAYPNATSAVRSLTDEILTGRDPERLRALLDKLERGDDEEPSTDDEQGTPDVSTSLAVAAANERHLVLMAKKNGTPA